LSADVINISGSTSSTVKGENLIDTARNLEAMSPDIMVIRHHCSGAAELLSQFVDSPIINAGDGSHEHPSQALLDLLTIRSHKGDLEGLKVAIVGDINHSRVARSNIRAMQTMGMKVRVVGPPPLIPVEMERLGVEVSHNLTEAIKDVDVIMVLRIQLERQNQGLLSSLREYSNYFCLTSESLAHTRDDLLIIHPGPVNRGIEIALDVMEGPRSLILNQVTNGVAVRMALFYLLLGEKNANPN
jgi:aspartate carbamoyltransferase catalytic subunit